VERYWQLLAIINGQQPFPAAVPAFQWLLAALRATVLARDDQARTGAHINQLCAA
jgi:hypothetical protein